MNAASRRKFSTFWFLTIHWQQSKGIHSQKIYMLSHECSGNSLKWTNFSSKNGRPIQFNSMDHLNVLITFRALRLSFFFSLLISQLLWKRLSYRKLDDLWTGSAHQMAKTNFPFSENWKHNCSLWLWVSPH